MALRPLIRGLASDLYENTTHPRGKDTRRRPRGEKKHTRRRKRVMRNRVSWPSTAEETTGGQQNKSEETRAGSSADRVVKVLALVRLVPGGYPLRILVPGGYIPRRDEVGRAIPCAFACTFRQPDKRRHRHLGTKTGGGNRNNSKAKKTLKGNNKTLWPEW